jgi:hypothetical protein
MPTVLLRFADLKARNIVNSWTKLKSLQAVEGFPSGFMLSPNIRAWREQEIDQWIAARPTVNPRPLKGAARTKVGNPGKRKAESVTATA